MATANREKPKKKKKKKFFKKLICDLISQPIFILFATN